MGKPNYKLNDIAEKAGVSTATVSRVLNGNPRISDKTTEKVLKIAEDLNYAPDLRFRWMTQNRGKPTAKTGNIGLLVDPALGGGVKAADELFMTDPYYERMFWQIEHELSRKNYHLLVTKVDTAADNYLPQVVKDMRVDGVLYVGYNQNMVERVSKVMPIVVLNSPFNVHNVSTYMPDEASGIRQAMDYLCELGHKKIYFFDIEDQSNVNAHHFIRRQAFEDYVKKHSLSEGKLKFIKTDKSSFDTVEQQLTQWQKDDDMPTAVICGADVHALSFLEVAEKMGINVPEELSVIGADNVVLCEHSRPRLTSINQPFEEIGRMGASRLIEIIEKPTEFKPPLLEVELVKRDSCANPK